jgi:hypothetical protein
MPKDKLELKKDEETATKESIPEISDDEVLDLILDKVKSADVQYRSNKEIYERLENLYFGNVALDSPVKELETQISTGQALQTVETITPRLTAGRIRVDFTETKASDKSNADLAEKLVNLQIESDNLEETLELWIRQAVKTHGALKVDFKLEEVKFMRKQKEKQLRIPMTKKVIGIGKTVEVEEVEEIFKHTLEIVSYEDLIIPPARDYNDLPFIGQNVEKTIFDMEQDDRYHNLENLAEYLVKNSPNKDNDEFSLSRNTAQDLDNDALRSYTIGASIPLREIYYKKDKYMYVVEYHEESGTVVRNEGLRYWHGLLPIRPLSIIPVENQVIGLSPLQTAEHQIDTLDIQHNTILTTSLFDLQRPLVFDPRFAGVNWQKNPPVYKAGMSYPMKDGAKTMTVLPAPKVDGSHLQMYGISKQVIQNITGVTDYISGGEQIDGDKTLGEVKLKTAQSNKRFEGVAKIIRRALTDVFIMMNSNNQQFLPEGYEGRIFGEAGFKHQRFSPESIQGKFDVRIKGFEDIFINEAEKVNKYQAMIADGLKVNQAIGKPVVDIPYLVSKLYSEGYKVDEMDKVIIPIEDTNKQEDGGKQAEAKRADAENKNPETAMLRPDEDMSVHLDVHEAFIQSPAYKQLPKKKQMILARHVGNTRKAMAGQQENQAPVEGQVPAMRPKDQKLQPPNPQQ